MRRAGGRSRFEKLALAMSNGISRYARATSSSCHETVMTERFTNDDVQSLEPVQEREGGPQVGAWTRRLVVFLRLMAVLSMCKGIYHWARVCGIGGGDLFEYQSIAWQTA